MRGVLAPIGLVGARTRRRPGHWLAPAAGIALAVAFAGAVAAEGVIAGDQSARAALNGLAPLDRSVRVTWQGVVTSQVDGEARALLRGLGLQAPTEVALMDPVRLGGVVVRPVAIMPLAPWLPAAHAARLGPCRARNCPVLLLGGGSPPPTLTAAGVRLHVVGSVTLPSAVPLGFRPATEAQQPVVVTGDGAGLDAVPGLSGVFRTHSWVSSPAIARLHSWQLATFEQRLSRSQSRLVASGGQFSLSGPFTGLDTARAQASAAPRRLLLAGGGAIAILALFVVLAGGGLRRDQLTELERLRAAGAREGQCLVFAAAESALVCAVALAAGATLGIAAAALLARASSEPAGAVLTHSLITPVGALAIVGGWLVASGLMTVSVLARDRRGIDLLAVAAASALVAGLSLGTTGEDRLAVLLAPLCALAAGVMVFRSAAAVLRAGEKAARRGPVSARIALVGLARSPSLPSLAIAFVAVTIGLGGFALAYRATLLRGAADQAANEVPLDAIVSPGPNFKTPLELGSLERWRSLAEGTVLPVRRTDANYASGAGTVTEPALGVPAGSLESIHGWRESDGSAPLEQLARRLRPSGPVRTPGPTIPPATRLLAIRVFSPALDVSVTADLRGPQGTLRQLALGTPGTDAAVLRAPLPPGRWELQAVELHEPTGLEITNGHQNAESAVPATQFQARVVLGPASALSGSGRPLMTVAMDGWRAVGAAATTKVGATHAIVNFSTTGAPGIVRPAQPSDTRPVPMVVDPQTAGAAGPGGRIALTVDGLPVTGRVVGVLQRFPTLSADAPGFVVADEATLGSALEAQLPGQGRPDELWVSTAHAARLKVALGTGPLAGLNASFRADLERHLRTAPIARGVLGTLLAAGGLAAALALLGLLTSMLGSGRDRRLEDDLEAQGIGPGGLRIHARIRLWLAALLGVACGMAIAVVLTALAVASVRSSGTVENPRPPLVTVVPWLELAAWGAGAALALGIAGWIATSALMRDRRARRPEPTPVTEAAGALSEGVAP
jgi:hypothetical protein